MRARQPSVPNLIVAITRFSNDGVIGGGRFVAEHCAFNRGIAPNDAAFADDRTAHHSGCADARASPNDRAFNTTALFDNAVRAEHGIADLNAGLERAAWINN